MANIKKNSTIFVFISVFFLFSISFLPQESVAEEWTYEMVDTLRIPEFSIYPSECYSWIYFEGSPIEGQFMMLEITKANLTDSYIDTTLAVNLPMGENGTCIWADQWLGNVSTGEKQLMASDVQLVYWNKSVGYRAINTVLIPLEENGTISEETFENASENWETTFFPISGYSFENYSSNINTLSCNYWNETFNQAYLSTNYTEDGILKDMVFDTDFGTTNVTLWTKPAQLTPVFSFSTDDDILTINSTDFKIATTITDADNNNDGMIDTDYLFRILNGSMWTSWATPTSLLDWDLGSVAAGNYTITMEVKNMYGVTQEEITIEYTPTVPDPTDDPDLPIISGYSFIAIVCCFSLGVSILLIRNRRNFK